MNNKKIIGLSLIATSCLAVSLSMIAVSKNNFVKMVRSEPKNYTLTFTKDNIYTTVCYRNSDTTQPYTGNAFFQLHKPGIYTLLNDWSYQRGSFGADGHLFTTEVRKTGARYCLRLDVNLYQGENPSTTFYHDQAKTQRIYTPGFSNLTRVQFVIGEGNTVDFNDSDYPAEDGWSVTKEDEGKIITIEHSNISTKVNALFLLDAVDETAVVGRKIVIDSVSVTYTCQ